MGVSPADRGDGRGRITGRGEICLLPTEHSHRSHCDHAHYGPMSCNLEVYGVKSGPSVVETERLGLGRYSVGVLGCRMGGGGGGGGEQEFDGDGLNMWVDNVANIILGIDTNAPLAYALVSEIQHPIVSEFPLAVHQD